MTSSKLFMAFAITAISFFSLSSCKKEHVPSEVTKEQLLGKWDMIVQSGGTIQQVHATLKGSGAMELDMEPYDGAADIILLWSTANNNFNAHLDYDSIPNLYEMHGAIDQGTLGIAGQFKLNDPQSPVAYIFTMDKQ